MVKNSPTLGTSKSYVASTLRKDVQVLFIIYTPNTPIGCTNVNSIEINKCKGQLGFPLKTKSPSGATTGGIPPQKKGPIFSQKIHRKCTKYASTKVLGEPTRDASGQKVKKHESGIAYASGRIRPFPLTNSPTSYSCKQNSPSQGSPKKIGRQNNTIAGVKNIALTRKHSNALKHNCLLQ
jgi:hypothetical protein